MYDVVTIGETMLRLTPDGLSRWEQAERLQIHVGGSESNTAVGLSRLGMRVCWLSRLTSNDFGRRITQAIQAQSVDTQHVIWTDEDRVGLYFYEEGSPPRSSRVIYDRIGSAFTRYSADSLPRELFQPGAAKCLHVTGISLALGETAREMIYHAVELARQAQWLVSFDVNYRSKLGSPAGARKHCDPLFKIADIVFVPQRDASALWNLTAADEVEKSLSSLAAERAGKLTVMTMGDRGAAVQSQGQIFIESIQSVPAVGRLGGGDAFSAGFLYGWLTTQDPQKSLQWANACAITKYSIPGDLPLFHRGEVEQHLSQGTHRAPFR